ncbi:MAG: Tol-Pal system beta propeller repeat protein TolB [Rhodospirillales bacterium]|nr:Tol-Pal system beta propeller repeat protein TolB [Rhodospirillales bacterium]MDH3913931.1 Tol-Pal system beta propeller repeat protein TolB [Rhodospirillales bacterium]MDH3968771.1 Tol-Pal system beta propeller repeat protein TolB [Rhodospirillales bacterium]
MNNSATSFVSAVALALAVALGSGVPARAELNVDITQGFVEPLPVAITDFYAETLEESKTGKDLAGVISADLERSGLFRPIDHGAFIQDAASLRKGPRFSDWRLINAQALIQGSVEMQPDGRLRVNFRLWDVFAEQQMTGLAYFTTPSNWRRVAHIVADVIYKRLTGEDGYFDTRLVYVAESGPQNRRVKRLGIMDQDGENHRFLTAGNELVLTPRFSPTTQEITYLSYIGEIPRVYLFNLNTGQQEVLGDFPGMTFAPRFSPDGNKVIMSLADDGNSEIFTMDLRTRGVKRLTSHPAIDTSPSYSPDGRRIAFNSDRGGSQQLYVMDSDGGNVRRISFNQGRYATPVWSPRGDLVAFTRMSNGEFYIGVMRPDGSGERMLTKGFLVEGPTWAPNGRVLSYFRQTPADSRGRVTSKVYTIDLTGFNERELATPIDASDPAWSPLIP